MSAILMYHYLGQPPASTERAHRALWVPTQEFRQQLRQLTRMGQQSVTPEQFDTGLRSGTLRNQVWLTFDDGRIDNLEQALPALVDAGHRATFFIIAERSLRGEKDYIPLSGLKEMLAAGMSIGSHTLTHPHLARIPPDQMRTEITDSRKRLEDALGVPVTSFCYPYGNWNPEAVEAVQQAGYSLAVSTIRDNRNAEPNRWLLHRAMVQPGRTGLRFRYLFTPVYHWIHSRKNRRRWNQR